MSSDFPPEYIATATPPTPAPADSMQISDPSVAAQRDADLRPQLAQLRAAADPPPASVESSPRRYDTQPIMTCIILAAIAATIALGTSKPIDPHPMVTLTLIGPFVALALLRWLSSQTLLKWPTMLIGLLCGTTISTTVTLLVAEPLENHSEILQYLLIAPVVEELSKGLVVVALALSRKINSALEAMVIAGTVAAGFALFENALYISHDPTLRTALERSIVTFPHMAATIATALGISLAIRMARPLWTGGWGLLVAIALHCLWNTFTIRQHLVDTFRNSTSNGGEIFKLAIVGINVLVLVIVLVYAVHCRRSDNAKLRQSLPWLFHRYRQGDVPTFLYHPKLISGYRRRLNRSERRRFDETLESLNALSNVRSDFIRWNHLSQWRKSETELIGGLKFKLHAAPANN